MTQDAVKNINLLTKHGAKYEHSMGMYQFPNGEWIDISDIHCMTHEDFKKKVNNLTPPLPTNQQEQ